MQPLTLAYFIRPGEICLGLKKRGFGEGNWNGYGGKLNANEELNEGTVREIEEESAVIVSPDALQKVARIEFIFENGTHLQVHTFFVRDWSGEPQETEEMRPAWFRFDEIPYEKMWEDDRYWLPRALLGEKLIGRVWFDASEVHIKEMEWQRVTALD